ncbi:hypothetical protein [Neptuniibacter halophilus]|uniref:hypothetical protein n=1 Tax=Neptuniibacter halophilus TaxID=651666 RepID=UPI0025745465|nr:hypothetical protein [Neptuniibacter halophilus]
MSLSDSTFHWDQAFFERKLGLLTNLQLGFVGAALMLLMMDLSRWYFLLPLAGGLMWISWQKQRLDRIRREVSGLQISLAPKSLLLKRTLNNQEQRITFREISHLETDKREGLDTFALVMRDDKGPVLIRGMQQQDQLLRQLQQAIEDRNSNQS